MTPTFELNKKNSDGKVDRVLNREEQRLLELGRQDTTTPVTVSVTVHTTPEFRFVLIVFLSFCLSVFLSFCLSELAVLNSKFTIIFLFKILYLLNK